jgi:general secretion pathway protein D
MRSLLGPRGPSSLLRRVWVVAAVAGLCACATSQAFRAGEQAERRQDYDRAVLEYSRALQLDPDNVSARRALERARLRASTEHLKAGRRMSGRGLYKEALDELRLALDLNPSEAEASREMQEISERLRSGTEAASLSDVKLRAREHALPGLNLGPEGREPLGLSFKSAGLREAYEALGKAAGVSFVFDASFQDQTISLDVQEMPFEQALGALGGAGRTFHRVTTERVITVVPDTPAKRREYEQQMVKTLFLSNADLKETIDLLRVVLGARRVAPLPGANALTINDSPDKVAAAERIVGIVDRRRAEVVVEVELLEVNRGRLKDYGIQITSGVPGYEGIQGAILPDPTKKFTLDDNPYAKDNLVVTSLPGVIYRLLQSDTSTRILANPQLRSSEGQTAQARFGDQVPVPVTTFAPIAQGGLQQQAITSFEYKNVGVNIDITPRVHHDGEVTLALKLDISQVGPPGYQGLPTFNSRTVTSVIRLKDGETNILAGLIRDTEQRSLTGIPGLASVPFLGRLFARNQDEIDQTDIVMTLTPHVVRRPSLTEEDLRSFQLGGEASPLLFEIPSTPAAPPGAPSLIEPKVEPIRPPAPKDQPPPRNPNE